MAASSRKLIFTALRVAVCVVALSWVLYGVSLRDYVELTDGQRLRLVGETDASVTVVRDGVEAVYPRTEIAVGEDGAEKVTYGLYTAVRQSSTKMLLLCLAFFAPVPFLQSLRFVWLLRAQEIHITFWESVKLSFAGNFLNFVALGTTGGDVVKAYYISLHTKRKTEAVTTVFLDRVLGLTGLLIMVTVVILFCTRNPELLVIGSFVFAALLGVVAGSVLLGWPRLRSWLRLLGPVARLIALAGESPAADPALPRLRSIAIWVLNQAQRADRATRRLLRHKRLVLGGLLATVVLQLIAISMFVLICRAVGMDFSPGRLWDYYAVTATANIIAAVPISPQGLGPVEATYKHFLLGSHANLSQLLCMAMGVRILQLLWALPGLLVTMTGTYKPQEEASPTTASVPPS
ncbi:MAG: lysylphosphatidylglycerol synthase transmembrane domain-containing protein [Planctomycetota bacterium]